MWNIWVLAGAVLLVNLPFGYWRAGTRRMTPVWIAAVHAPVPLVVTLRVFSGIGWQLSSFPAVIVAYFLGQLLGGKIRRFRETRSEPRSADRSGVN